jgi:thiol:disulfide interchange protein DsbA
MKLRLALPLSLMLIFSACSRSPAPPAEAPPATPAAEAPAAEPAPAAAAAEPAAAAAPAETPAPPPAPDAPAAPAPQAAATTPVQGTDFEVIDGGEPFAPVAGKIEVVEYFNYVCPACASFNPDLQKWKATLPADVHVVFIAADFRGDFIPYARAYYAAESFGLVDKTHDEVYKAIHETHALPGEGEGIDENKIADYYVQKGAPGAEMFVGAMHSFAVDVKLKQGRAFAMRSKITSTPSLIINGKYRVIGKTWDEKLAIASWLIERERKAKK